MIGRCRPASVAPLIYGEGFVHHHTTRRLHGLSNRWKQIALQVARDEKDIERPGRQSPRGQIGAPSMDDQSFGTRAGRRFANGRQSHVDPERQESGACQQARMTSAAHREIEGSWTGRDLIRFGPRTIDRGSNARDPLHDERRRDIVYHE